MLRVVFVHPDLGIGGAERLVVDAALGLQRKGHDVRFFTSHHDPNHCFEETKNGTFPVSVVGDWIPRGLQIDVIVCDQVSVAVPIFKFGGLRTIFYCHFPDQLLSTPGGTLKKFYRKPLNYLEEVTTGYADRILVNSAFTVETFKKTFTSLRVTPDILYPSLNTKFFDEVPVKSLSEILPKIIDQESCIFLSINRYERKKDLALAVHALSELEAIISEAEWERVHLVIAGGYDLRVTENVEHFTELVHLSTTLKLEEKITFLKSPSDTEKVSLLSGCTCLVYTPSNEHFGIVPLEAMYMKKTVIAVNSGGPKETVLHEETGFLCKPDPSDFALTMRRIIRDSELRSKMGIHGRNRVINNFSFQSFSFQFDQIVSNTVRT